VLRERESEARLRNEDFDRIYGALRKMGKKDTHQCKAQAVWHAS